MASGLSAFELLPVIESVTDDKPGKSEVSSLELWESNLYIGTSDGFLLYFILEKGVSPTGKTTFQSRLEAKKQLGLGKKPIEKILAVPKFQKLLVISNGTLIILHMYNMKLDTSPSSTMKSAFLFCHDEAAKSRTSICIARRKSSTQRVLALYKLGAELSLENEINISEIPLAMARFGNTVCFATPREYALLKVDSGEVTELFQFDAQFTRPFVKTVGAAEFLVGQSTSVDTLALFINNQAQTTRPPLQLASNPVGIAYRHPYVVSLCESVVQVHGALDQQLKQTVQFRGSRALVDGAGGEVFLSTSSFVYDLVQIPIPLQVQSLLKDRRVAEALLLAEEALPTESDDFDGQKRKKQMRRIQQQAGFVYLTFNAFDAAEDMFKKSFVDPREVVALFPSLMPRLSTFRPERPPLHGFADISSAVGESRDNLSAAHSFLCRFLEFVRETRQALGKREEIDTALLKMYADAALASIPGSKFASPSLQPLAAIAAAATATQQPASASASPLPSAPSSLLSLNEQQRQQAVSAQSKYERQKQQARIQQAQESLGLTLPVSVSAEYDRLIAFVSQHSSCAQEDCEEHLQLRKLHHPLALFYASHGFGRKALDIWLQLEEKQLHDPSYGGLGHVIDYLRACTQTELVWKYAEFVLRKSPTREGARIFTERIDGLWLKAESVPFPSAVPPPPSDARAGAVQFQAEEVLEFLPRFGREPVIAYLEFLIHLRQQSDEKLHTQLALLYIEEVLELIKSAGKSGDDESVAARIKSYRELLSEFLERSSFYRAPVILGKIRDSELYAECATLYGKMDEHEKALHILVHKLKDFKGAERYCQVTQGEGRDFRRHLYLSLLKVYMAPQAGDEPLLAPAVDLLNNHGSKLDVVEVLQLLPTDWSIGLVSQFLQRGIDENVRHSRETLITKNLLRSQYISVRHEYLTLRNQFAAVTDTTKCDVCDKLFSDDAAVARYPNGVKCHLHCCKVDKTVCPVTNVKFVVDK